MRPLVAILALLMLGTGADASAQTVCRPGDDSNEARTLAHMSVPVSFTRLDAPARLPAWRVGVGLEVAWIPTVDSALTVPTACRPGKGGDQVNQLDLLPRPRVDLGLPGGLTVELSWVPPFRVRGVEANLVGLALSFNRPLGAGDVTVGARVHLATGTVRAAITCPAPALDDPDSECFEGEASDDRFEPLIAGIDLQGSVALAGGRLRPFAGAGYARVAPDFQVHFVNRLGELDDTRVAVRLDRLSLTGGANWSPGRGFTLAGEVHVVPVDATTARLAVRWWPGG